MVLFAPRFWSFSGTEYSNQLLGSPNLSCHISALDINFSSHTLTIMASHAASDMPQPSPATASTIPNLQNRIPKLEPRRRRPATSNSIPLPEARPLSPPACLGADWAYKVPARRILSKADHDAFLASHAYRLVVAWIFELADAVVDTPCSAAREENFSPAVKTIMSMLDQVEGLVQQSPPDEQGGSRFGNKAFCGFLDLVREKLPVWHRDLGVDNVDAAAEASAYLSQSFGNYRRIDYGSGHELNFMMWLLCLYQLGIIPKSDFKPLVLRVFTRYLTLMRAVQMTYYLEPAGSHGVWGLDDYQFLPFLFGASQLVHHPFITPLAIHQNLTIEEFSEDFMYLGQVAFVNSTKTVQGLRWHSPMLDDISSAKSWTKIEAGMRRMFVAEVLGKLPVMQHFLFGSLIPAPSGMSEEVAAPGDDDEEIGDEDHSGHDHEHNSTGWGDCCGIKVPSSIAAAQEKKKAGEGQALRRIPFD